MGRGTARQDADRHSRYRPGRTHFYVWLGGLVASATVFFNLFVLAQHSFSVACMVSTCALAGVFLSYGAIKPKLMVQGGLGYSPGEISAELAKAEDRLYVIEKIARALPLGDIQQRLHRIVRKSHNVLSQIQTDPGDLRRARKFLSVFLPGTQDVTETYWKVHQSGSSDAFERRFRGVLAKVEEIVENQIRKLKDNEEFDLDVQMEVLLTQMSHE